MNTIPEAKVEICRAFLQETIPQAVKPLLADEFPDWGKMTPQHMIEHLETTIVASTILSHKEKQPPTALQREYRDALIHSDAEMPRNVQNPIFQFGLPAYKYADIEMAKEKLVKGIEMFFRVYQKNPQGHNFNPFLGDLLFEETLVFHYKHFKHHFTQFKLIS